MTCAGTTIASREGHSGSDFLTTRRPSLAIVTLLRYLLTFVDLVSFLKVAFPAEAEALLYVSLDIHPG